MTSRRQLILSGIAALGAISTGASAQEMTRAIAPLPEDALAPRLVPIQAGLPAGEIHLDPDRFALYWTQADGTAIRYACGVGRPGLYEAGAYYVGEKKEWPSWTPTPDMIAREPELYEQYADGMPGGPGNPLGARALYLFTPERGDTFLRIHGTDAPQTIGAAVSNGCARLLDAHIIDLYDRVPVGTPIFLYPQEA